MIFNAFKSEIFQLPPIEGTGHLDLAPDLALRLKILTPKQMFQRL